MSTNYPGSLDNGTSIPNPTGVNTQNSPDHASLHSNTGDGLKAVEAKLGIGATTPTSNTLLFGTGTGTSAWGTITSAQLLAALSDETGTGKAVFGTSPTLVTPAVDTINESTPGNGTTVGGVNIKSGVLATSNSVVTTNITNAAITSAKISGIDKSLTTTDSNPYKFRVRRTSALTLGGGAFQKITFNTEDYDTNNNYDNVTNFRYTAPVSGFYHFSGGLEVQVVGALLIILYKNGLAYHRGSRSGNAGIQAVIFSDSVQVAAGDYFEMYTFYDGTNAIDVNSADTQPYFAGELFCRT